MKLTIAFESVLIILMLLLGWRFVANHDISLKGSTPIHNTSFAIYCDGTTSLWDDYDPSKGTGGNHIDFNSPYCGGNS